MTKFLLGLAVGYIFSDFIDDIVAADNGKLKKAPMTPPHAVSDTSDS